jgi:hypothetical protein
LKTGKRQKVGRQKKHMPVLLPSSMAKLWLIGGLSGGYLNAAHLRVQE